jgi:hypothetical protein
MIFVIVISCPELSIGMHSLIKEINLLEITLIILCYYVGYLSSEVHVSLYIWLL